MMPMSHRLRLFRYAASSAAIVLVAGCSCSPSPSRAASPHKATVAPVGASTPAIPRVVLPGHVVFDRTRGADVSNIYLYYAGREKQLTALAVTSVIVYHRTTA
ncbi:MAG: hypothetical protein QOH48_257 [Actinomycetota bacterium]|jgi:multidrug efflux pump subunit AcrA (membrane-fusion protein)|nr:hypothetical protein [Actinomycetota bacterium]